MRYFIVVGLAAAISAGCWSQQEVISNVDNDAGANTDTDTDADTDTDSDSDSDPHDCAGGRYDQSTGLCWQHPTVGGLYEWQVAIDYCNDLDLAGHSDWYLPSRNDFIDLLGNCDSDVMSGDNGYCNSCDESTTCSTLFGSDIDAYWSSSLYDPINAWHAHFYNGYVSIDEIDCDDYVVHCVRAGP